MTITFACAAPPPDPEVTFMRYDAEAGCWYWTTETLDPLYWAEWAVSECTHGDPLFSADQAGQCIRFNSNCGSEPTLPADPWLAGCEAFPECCAEPTTEALFCE